MKITLLTVLFTSLFAISSNAELNDIKLTSPKANDSYRTGRTVILKWDTLDSKGNSTYNSVFEFYWSESQDGPWSLLALTGNAKSFTDAKSGKAAGTTNTILPRKPQLWIRMQLKSNPEIKDMVGPVSIIQPAPNTPDTLIKGEITQDLTLSSHKTYGLQGIVYVKNGNVLRIEPGTKIFGDPNAVSCICINRGGKIYAQGTPQNPIIMTSGYAAGSRDRGDWGGLLIMGSAETNLGESAIEGGIADDENTKENGWYGRWNGVNNNEDSSGVLSYVRIEFAGIAASPDNELNGLTLGAVGSRTKIDHVQVSYGGDDSFEWFGGTVNCKYLIAYNGIDDDFDTDNGYRGKVQFGFSKRFRDIADISNSEAFESDNDSKSSENMPYTMPVFSNMTVIGPVKDTSWTPGTGDNKYNPKYLAAAQIRRNSRLSLLNSVIAGWPAGVEMTNQNTVRAAENDSIHIRYNDFYGIRNNKFFYFGSGTTPSGIIDINWMQNTSGGNIFVNSNENTGALAYLGNAYPAALSELDPLPTPNATYLSTANFTDSKLLDPFFDIVSYRGAFGSDRWDLPWAEYDPVNADYRPTGIEETMDITKSHINVAPQPANSNSIITYYLSKPERVNIKIYDALGNIAGNIAENESQGEGYHSIRLDSDHLPSGIYYLQMITPSKITITKVIIAR